MPEDKRTYWDIATVEAEPRSFEPLPPLKFEKPDPMLVAVLRDSEDLDAFQSEARDLLDGPAFELPADVFAPSSGP